MSPRVKIVASADIMTDLSKFDPQISSKAAALFSNGQTDMSAIFGHLQGKMVTPQNIHAALTPLIQDLKTPSDKGLAVDMLADIALLGSGSGTLVDLGSQNYFYNIGYTVPVVKSGRSYAVSPSRALLDPSDTYYLSEMDSVLGSSHPGAPDSFLGVVLNVILNCDPSAVSSLDSSAQTALIDFVAVYTAELDRACDGQTSSLQRSLGDRYCRGDPPVLLRLCSEDGNEEWLVGRRLRHGILRDRYLWWRYWGNPNRFHEARHCDNNLRKSSQQPPGPG